MAENKEVFLDVIKNMLGEMKRFNASTMTYVYNNCRSPEDLEGKESFNVKLSVSKDPFQDDSEDEDV